jgi:hypothetical protein
MNNKIAKVYSTRNTKNIIKIKLHCLHDCKLNICNIVLKSDINDPTIFVINENPLFKNGKCSMSDKIEKSYVKISDFDLDNPLCDGGILYNPDEKVIADNSFIMSISFPLSVTLDVHVNNDMDNTTNKGFSLKEIIHSIKFVYKFIYDEEERSATPNIFTFSKTCSECTNKHVSEYIHDFNGTVEDNCSICYNDYISEKPIRLNCNHIFHNSCILEWINNSSSYSCPICRAPIFTCDNCDSKGLIYYYFRGVTVPVENRNIFSLRNPTDGVFGIHTVDYEDLILESMTYDNINKKLFIHIK